MDLQVGRSLTWAGSSGLFSPRERKQIAVSAYFCWFLSGGTKIEKINMSKKWALSIPNDAARLGDLGKRVFGPKFLKNSRFILNFRFLAFSDVVGHEF